MTDRRGLGGKFFRPGSQIVETLLSLRFARRWVAALLLVAAFSLGPPAIAHDSNCDNSVGGDPIHCSEETSSTDNINIDVSGIDIDTSGNSLHDSAVKVQHLGNGNTDINITGTTTTPSTIDTTNTLGIMVHYGPATTGTVTVTLENTEISTQGNNSGGIRVQRAGSGATEVDLNPGVVIETSGDRSRGVSLTNDYVGAGADATLETQGIRVTTRGDVSSGLWVKQAGSGELQMEVNDSTIVTHGNTAHGIYGYRLNSNGDINIDVVGGSTTTGDYLSFGIYGRHQHSGGSAKTGNIEIRTRNHAIETTGTAHYSSLQGTYAYGIAAYQENSGNIDIDLGEGSSIITRGKNSHGIVAYQFNTEAPGNIDIMLDGPVTVHGADAQGVRVGTLSGTAPVRVAPLDSDGYRLQKVTVNRPITSTAEGVFLANGGRVIIGPQGRIRSGSGIAILATGTVPEDSSDPQNVVAAIPPKLRVDFNLGGRQRVADAIGDDWILNDGGETTIAVNRTVLHDGKTGVTGATAANGVWDVTMLTDGLTVTDTSTDPFTVSARDPSTITDRDFSAADFTEVEVRDPEPQEYRINEAVSVGPDATAGVHVEGDGKVYIGAQGRIEAASGIAILATGDAPDLLVDVTLDERRVAEVIGDDWIINDGGGTTLVINDVKLHDGTTGVVPEASAPNGAFDVRVRAEGVRVLDHADPDPANWTISDLAAGVIADRDFSVEDFIETRKEPEPAQPSMFVEEYAPRAALYESLPGLLLRLDAGAPVRRPEQPAWVQAGYGAGRGEADHSQTGASYDFDRIEAAAGISQAWGDNLGGSVWLRRLQSEVKVDMPAGSGELELHGVGAGVQGHWREADGPYVSGALSWTDFDVDASSEKRGRLAKGEGCLWQARLEAGYLMARGGGLTLRPRAWLWHAEADVDGFTDAVGAQVSGVDESRTAAGLGLLAELAQSESSLYGSVDVESVFAGEETVVEVSTQRLVAESERTRVWIGMGGQQQGKRVTLRGGLRLGDPGGRNQEFSASVSVSGNF